MGVLFPSEWQNQRATHVELNRFIQSVQEEAHAWGFETRHGMVGDRAQFDVFLDGYWHTLASEVPFTRTDEERQALINPDLWMEMQASAARTLAHS